MLVALLPSLSMCGTEVGNGDQVKRGLEADAEASDKSPAWLRFSSYAVALVSDCSEVAETMWSKTAYEVTLDDTSYQVEISGDSEKSLLFDGELVLTRRDGQIFDADDIPVATDSAKCESPQNSPPPSGESTAATPARQTITGSDGAVTVAQAAESESGELTQITASQASEDSKLVMVAID